MPDSSQQCEIRTDSVIVSVRRDCCGSAQLFKTLRIEQHLPAISDVQFHTFVGLQRCRQLDLSFIHRACVIYIRPDCGLRKP